jgi:hypothetical protein
MVCVDRSYLAQEMDQQRGLVNRIMSLWTAYSEVNFFIKRDTISVSKNGSLSLR